VFIALEGGDGAGKSTQAQLLRDWLERLGHTVVVTREPGGTPFGRTVRELVLHGDHVAPRAEALLFAADRAHHVETVIAPALNEQDVDEIPEHLRKDLDFHFVSEVRDLLKLALDPGDALAGARARRRTAPSSQRRAARAG